MGADSDRSPAQVVFAHIHRVESRVPGSLPPGEDLGFEDRIVLQRILGDVVLAGGHILEQMIARIAVICGEEDIFARPSDLAKGRDQRSQICVADVVLLAVRQVGAVGLRGEAHSGGVNICPVRPLRKPEGEDVAVMQQVCGAALERFVPAHPDRTQSEDGHLPGVPVGQAVEAEDLIELAVAPGIPAAVRT